MERGRINLPMTMGSTAVMGGLGGARASRSWRSAHRTGGASVTLRRDEAAGNSPARDASSWGAPTAPNGAGQRPELFRDQVQRLHDDVHLLADTIGERHDRTAYALANLQRAAEAIERRFAEARLPVQRRRANGDSFNVEAVLRGGARADETVVVGAHYDSSQCSPGADDNASGVAALLSLATVLTRAPLQRTVRLVAFAAGQYPHAGTEAMGSRRYVREIERDGTRVTGMLGLDSLGLYTSRIPLPLRQLPVLGSDLLLLGDWRARRLQRRSERAFDHANTGIRVMAATLPVPFASVRASDHWSFARAGIPAFVLTDFAPLWTGRDYGGCDTADKLDYERLGLTCLGVASVVRALANG